MLVQSLTARNQTANDLLVNLFKGYGAVSDKVFCAWLLRKQDDNEEGEEITPDELMLSAKNEYDTMVEKGIWNAPTTEEKIVALEAMLESTVKSLSKIVTEELGKNKKQGGKHSSEASKHTKGDAKLEDHPKKWAAPKAGNKREVTFKGHTWFWCGKDTGGKCEKRRVHKPTECKGLASTSGGKRKPSTNSSPNPKKKDNFAKKLKVAKGYVAKIEQHARECETDDSGEDSE